jgi:hypothetical protein
MHSVEDADERISDDRSGDKSNDYAAQRRRRKPFAIRRSFAVSSTAPK